MSLLGVLNVNEDDSAPKPIRCQQSGSAMDLTDFAVECRIGTAPVTTRACTVVTATDGTLLCNLGSLPVGTWQAAFYLTNIDGTTVSDPFVINVREGL